jgi:hypothetical protein
MFFISSAWQPKGRSMAISTRGNPPKTPALRAFSRLAGSPASTVKISIPPFKQTVVVHFCFDQERGELKPDRCKCDLRILRDEAYELTDSDQADWLLMKTKTEKRAKCHKAIVMRRAIVNGETLFALTPSVKPSARDAKHESIKNDIKLRARRILQKLLAAGTISPEVAKISDVDLEGALKHPEGFLERIPARKKVRGYFQDLALRWWNNVLGYHRLSENAGKFMNDADHGAGLAVSGGFNSSKLDQVDGARETDDGRVSAANHVPRYWNGGWDFSTGADPRIDYDEEDHSKFVEYSHSHDEGED